MPLRSVLDIDVNDDKLKAVVDLMGKYQAAAARMPGAWASIGKQQATSKDVLVDMRNLMLVHIALLDRESKAFEGVRRQVDSTHRSMQGLSRSTREFVGHMRSATSVLLRWSGASGLIAGLAGVLSAEGIARLAGTGAGMFRSSASLAGTSPGQVGAAGAYGGILNPRQVLGQISQMLTTAEGKRGLLGVGIGQNQWGAGAGAILPQFLTNLQRLSKSPMVGPNAEIMGDVLNAQGLGQFTELAQILRNMKPEQLAQLTNEYTKNQRELNKVTNETLFQYVKLQGTIEVAEAKIKSAFIIALEPMAPQFARIADALSTAILNFGESKTVKKWMDELATSLEGVDMDAFAKRLEGLGESLVTLGRAVTTSITAMANWVSWIDRKTGLSSDTEEGAAKRGLVGGAFAGAAIGSVFGPAGAVVGGAVGAVSGAYAGARSHQESERDKVRGRASIPPPRPGEYGYGQTPSATRSRWTDGTATGSSGGAYGKRMQEMIAVAREAGFTGDAAVKIAAIAMAESRGDSMAHNQRGRDDSYGITQINALAHGPIAREALGNDKRAMELAYKISKGGTDFTPWSVYNDRKYERYMGGGGQGGGGPGGGGPSAFITHHTGGLGTVAGVMATLQQRGLGVQYIMDREGNVHKTGGPGSKHMKEGWGPLGTGLSNANTVGMEIIARNDADVTKKQQEAFAKFMHQNYPNTPIFGHGEVNPGHKQATEGMAAKIAALAYRREQQQVNAADLPEISVRRPSNVRVTVQNETGANPISSTAQVSQ